MADRERELSLEQHSRHPDLSEDQVNNPENTAKQYLDLWCVRMKDGDMFVEGNLLTPPYFRLAEAAHRSCKIVKQLKSGLVQDTKGGLYALEGRLCVRESSFPGFCPLELTPWLILDRFAEGFPTNWAELGRNWVAHVERQREEAGGLGISLESLRSETIPETARGLEVTEVVRRLY